MYFGAVLVLEEIGCLKRRANSPEKGISSTIAEADLRARSFTGWGLVKTTFVYSPEIALLATEWRVLRQPQIDFGIELTDGVNAEMVKLSSLRVTNSSAIIFGRPSIAARDVDALRR